MLVLTRKIGESIFISDNIIVKIIDVENNRVRVGIKAPDNIDVFREEIYHLNNQKKIPPKSEKIN